MNLDYRGIVKPLILYVSISFGFSLLGLILPGRTIQPPPLESFTLTEVGGHVIWGLVVGAATLNLRYMIFGGAFAVLIDSDHLIALSHLEMVARMAHSISFGAISVIIMMFFFGRKNYLLGAIVVGALLSHISYDTFASYDGIFPLFAPFDNNMILVQHHDWFFIELAGVAIVGVAGFFTRRKISIEQKSSK